MVNKIALTDDMLMAMKATPQRKVIVILDAVQPYLGVRISEFGTKSFFIEKRIKGVRRAFNRTLGKYPDITLDDARERTRLLLGQIAAGIDPKKYAEEVARAPAPPSFAEEEARAVVQPIDEKSFVTVARAFITEHASKRAGGRETERIINTYLLPSFGNLQIGSIPRLEIITLLDRIRNGQFESEHGEKLGGPSMADHVLGSLRTLFNWYADRDDDFRDPRSSKISTWGPRRT